MKMKVLFLLVCVCAVSALIAQTIHPSSKEIQNILITNQTKFSVPALSAAVVFKDEILSAEVGTRIAGKDLPVISSSRFHIGSVTKPMTATVIATVVESGKLSWDSKVVDVFPDWKESIQPEFHDITLADLLSHQAGVQGFTEDSEFASLPEWKGTSTEQRRNFALYALKQKPVAKPKQEYFYSNAGFTIAAVMAEKVTDEAWEVSMQRMFKAVDMRTAGFGWPAKTHPEEPWGHWIKDGTLQPHDPNGEYQLGPNIAPAGDVHVSMIDLAKFARLHLRGVNGRAAILQPATFKQLHTKRVKSGLGWGIQELLGFEPVSGYSGSAETFLTYIALLHKENVAVVVSANAYSETIDQACKTTLKELIQRYGKLTVD